MKRLLTLFAVSLAVRLVFLAVVELPVLPDGVDYLRLGDHLLQTGELGYEPQTRTLRGPVYPVFIAACQWIAGTDTREATVRVVGWVQSVLSALIPLVIYGLARRGFSERTALVSGYLSAVYPDLVFYSGMVMTESLSLLLMLAGMLAFMAAWEGRGRTAWGSVAGGVSLAAGVLARGLAASGVLALAAWVVAKRGDLKVRPRHTALALVLLCIGGLALEVPWVARNYRVHGALILNTAGDLWSAVYVGYRPEALYNEMVFPEYFFAPDVPELEQDARMKADTLQWVRENPGLAALLVYGRSLRFWIPWRDIGITGLDAFWPGALNALAPSAAFGVLLLAAPFGFALRRGRTPAEWTLLAHAAIIFVLCCLTHWETRFRFSVIPVLLMYAADLWVHRRAYGTALRDGLSGFRRRAGLAAAFVVYHLAGTAAIFWFLER